MPSLYGFQKKELLRVYENMILSRLLDEKMAILLRQGKGFFHMACSGHEAAQIAAAFNFKSAKDKLLWDQQKKGLLQFHSILNKDNSQKREILEIK